MWSTLAYLGRSTITAKDMEGLIRRGALVELWAVTPPSDAFDPRGGIRADIGRSMMSGTWYHDRALSDAFNEQLVSQLANPDPNVRRGVVRHLAGQNHAEGLLVLVRKVELTRLGKEQLSKLLEEEFAGRRKVARGTEAEALEVWASELLEALGCGR